MSDDIMTVVLTELPDCQFVHGTREPEPANYDGKTIHGPWAYMCEGHFKMYGVGLGTGRGQLLVKRVAEAKPEMCNCEHSEYHFENGKGHPYLGVPAGERTVEFAGKICDDCVGHMTGYLTN